MNYKVGDSPVVRDDLVVGRCYGGQRFVQDEEPKTEKYKTAIVAEVLVVTESYQPLFCHKCNNHLGRRGTTNGHDYDDTAGWKYCPFCGKEIEE